MPKISVIVPVYKAENLLRTCVDSALAQTYTDIEIILVDDGSPDSSGRICDEYAASDARVRVIHQANAGVSAARNAGIGIARGDYLLFLDSDDYLDRDACKKLVGAFKISGADVVGCGNWNVGPDGERVGVPFFLPAGTYEKNDIMDKIVRPMLRDRTSGSALNGFIWHYLFSREVVTSNGISFSGAYLEDELFLIEYLCCANRLISIQENLYSYYNNPASATKRYMKNFEEVFMDFFAAKSRLVSKFDIQGISGWENSTLWAGILIAVGNEYAPGNDASILKKCRNLKALCEKEPFRSAIASGKPSGAGKRKRIVIDLVSSKSYWLLTLLYLIKNSGR